MPIKKPDKLYRVIDPNYQSDKYVAKSIRVDATGALEFRDWEHPDYPYTKTIIAKGMWLHVTEVNE